MKKTPTKNNLNAGNRGPHTQKGNVSTTITIIVVLIAVAVVAGVFLYDSGPGKPSTPSRTVADARFAPGKEIKRFDLEQMQWSEMNQAIAAVGTEPARIDQLIQLAKNIDVPAATYMRGLLLITRQKPEEALLLFETLDIEQVPVVLLYAPYRLHQQFRPGDPNPYIDTLRAAVKRKKVPALVRARVQAADGDFSGALDDYLRTNPAQWAGYDLDAMRRIAGHQGLIADLNKMIAGALSSGRVKPALVAPLRDVTTQSSVSVDIEAFRQNLRRSIDEKTPQGKLAIESARKLLLDRKMFLERNYEKLLADYIKTEPMILSTETMVLLFLSAVTLKEQLETDRWGQELKRRHNDQEVWDWVNELTASTR